MPSKHLLLVTLDGIIVVESYQNLGKLSWYCPFSKWPCVYFPFSFGRYILAVFKQCMVFFPRDTFFIVKDMEGAPHQKLTGLIQVGTEKKLITFSPFWWFIQVSKTLSRFNPTRSLVFKCRRTFLELSGILRDSAFAIRRRKKPRNRVSESSIKLVSQFSFCFVRGLKKSLPL